MLGKTKAVRVDGRSFVPSRHATGRLRFKPFRSRQGEMAQEELQHRVVKQLDLINHYFDNRTYLRKLEQSSFKDIMTAQGVLIEKHLLMRAPPTIGLQPTERESLCEFLPKLIQEAQRRGITATLTQAKLTLPAGGGSVGESLGEIALPGVPAPRPPDSENSNPTTSDAP